MGNNIQYPKLYIDSHDVERGYYVYAHRCIKSGKIFYIGKGKEERAWSDARSNAWVVFVESLEMGYEVILLHTDLTEIESIDLERVEIQANGGAASQGGSLLNWIPGEAGHGFGVAVKLEISLNNAESERDKESNERSYRAYINARKYVDLSSEQRRNLEKSYVEAMAEEFNPIEKQYWICFDADQDTPFLIGWAYHCYMEVCSLCRQLRNKKISYADFCEQADSEIEGFVSQVNDESNCNDIDASSKSQCHAFALKQVQWSRVYSEGTFDEANKASIREWIKGRHSQ